MRLVWCTDVHLNFLPEKGISEFASRIRAEFPDLTGVVLSGDIAECPTFAALLEEFQAGLQVPVWFVLGNHDAYDGSVAEMKAKAHAITNPMVHYLVKKRLVELAPGIALVGHDGWYDARNGEPLRSNVILNDFFAIREFSGHWGSSILSIARRIADASAEEARGLLEEAIAKGYKTLFFATHVPPYALSSWHNGDISNASWLPWMSSRAMGEMLDEVLGAHPDVSVTVLCGHTHSSGKYQRAPNLTVLTGHSEYGSPRVCGDFTLP